MFKVKDHYYKKAKNEKFVARSIYKLEEIDKKYKVIKPMSRVLDLGYYPGSWTQYCSQKLGEGGLIVGLDIQEVNTKINELSNVKLLKKDIFEVQRMSDIGENELFDCVISDMAPKTTGIKSVDQDRSLNLVEAVFEVLPLFLKNNGNFVIKVFDSNDAQVYLKTQRSRFHKFAFLKPKSTRSVSKEFFVIGLGFKA